MPPRPFVNDALWRCLCPGFPPSTTPRLARTAPRLARTSSTPLRPVRSPRSHCAYTTSTRTTHYAPPLAPRAKPAQLSIPQLYNDLRAAGIRGHFDDAVRLCGLLQDRGHAPDKDMYAALLHALASSSDGTGGKLRAVLADMGFWGGGAGVELDARGCENALEALAVHPDYLLRAEVLQYMRARWMNVSDRAQGFVVVGYLRERGFEQALELLEALCARQVRVEEWVWSVALWTLLEYGEVEEAFWVLGLRESVLAGGRMGRAYRVRLSDALWGALMDAAAQQQMYDAARLVWTAQVQPGYLKPATGTCVNVLALASRHGDVQLATDVFRVLTERGTIFTTHHYELLIATHLAADALDDALAVILIMVDANLKVDAGTCSPLYWYLRNAPAPSPPADTSTDTSTDAPTDTPTDPPSMPLHAFTLLQSLEAQGRTIPVAAVNCCIQAAVALAQLPTALEIYKALHTVCPSGPNTATFNQLLRGCAATGRHDLALYLAAEMLSLGLRPDRITYDRLILVCESSAELDDALAYWEEMRGQGMRPRRGTYEALVKALCEAGDARCVAVLRDYKESGETVSGVERRVRERFEADWRGEGGEDELRVEVAA
ncbi:hypothetical protein C7974DRAFT_311790 [Boeremia exigua]|uniref:uncharacterized protein n=1 Tax=Boeremia exigua TaxID=749465 RepID=UPI001E8CA460|nr:uncharacterized protein C7974DRAFT_311790 [Boeremia exigua]KAH6629372.1 hypothetical protein C7974DRAFT_311790 [Boeremia exigua]